MASFLYCFPCSYRSSNYCDINSCRSFTLLKALAKSNGNLIAIAFKSDIYRYCDSWESDNFRAVYSTISENLRLVQIYSSLSVELLYRYWVNMNNTCDKDNSTILIISYLFRYAVSL